VIGFTGNKYWFLRWGRSEWYRSKNLTFALAYFFWIRYSFGIIKTRDRWKF
jgi:hypothetical protein